jgi:TatD DNase family protein
MIDMHCHLDRYPNPKQIADKARRAGVTVIAVTNLPSHFRDGFVPASQLSNVRLSLGLHPLLAPHPDMEYRLFSELLPKTSYVGEIGLDFGKEGLATREVQMNSFRFVLKEIQKTGKVLSIHSRKAEHKTMDLLDEYNIRGATFHWFTGDSSALTRVLESGHYLSVNPAMFQSNRRRSTLNQIPKERVLFETDGPYCKVVAGPWDVTGVASELANLWRCTLEAATLQVSRNFRQMLTDRQSS